jgi:hypothetical protein
MADQTQDDAPTGMPEDQREETPLGVDEADPEGDNTEPGPDAMPGVPTEGEPPAAS